MYETTPMNLINRFIGDYELEAFHGDNIHKKISFSELRGKWFILFFYPADFTFVCPTELEEIAELYPEFQKLNCEIFSVSTDTTFVHKAWHDNSPAIAKVQFPMIADPTGNLSKSLGVYIEEAGLALRGSFIVDPDGAIKAFEVHDTAIGRSGQELLRKVQAAQYVREHDGEVCPAKWQPGKETLRPSADLVGKL